MPTINSFFAKVLDTIQNPRSREIIENLEVIFAREKDANPNVRKFDSKDQHLIFQGGETLLHAAIKVAPQRILLELVQFLVKKGAKVNLGTPSKFIFRNDPPLSAAIIRGHIPTVEFLIQQGATLNHSNSRVGVYKNYLDLAIALFVTAEMGSRERTERLQMLNLLLRKGAKSERDLSFLQAELDNLNRAEEMPALIPMPVPTIVPTAVPTIMPMIEPVPFVEQTVTVTPEVAATVAASVLVQPTVVKAVAVDSVIIEPVAAESVSAAVQEIVKLEPQPQPEPRPDLKPIPELKLELEAEAAKAPDKSETPDESEVEVESDDEHDYEVVNDNVELHPTTELRPNLDLTVFDPAFEDDTDDAELVHVDSSKASKAIVPGLNQAQKQALSLRSLSGSPSESASPVPDALSASWVLTSSV